MVLSVWNRLLMKFIKGKPIPSWSNHHGHRGHQQKGIRPDSASAEDQMLARGWRSTCGLHQYGDGLELGLSTALRDISQCLVATFSFGTVKIREVPLTALTLEPPLTAFLWLCKYHLPFGSSETRLTFTFAICLQLILPGALVEDGEEWN